MILVRAGFQSGEVRNWSQPKLILWTELAEEASRHFALLQSAAVWDPKSVVTAGERVRPAGKESETPLSEAEFKKLVG